MKKQVEPIILTVALFLLGLGAVLFAYFYPSVPAITGIPALTAQGKNVTPLKAEDVAASLAIWAGPTSWEEPSSHNRLFHSDKFLFYASLYPSGDYIARLSGDSRLPSGMLISWCDAHHLDFTDVNVDREDPDNDGFSNLTEFKNEPVGAHYKAAITWMGPSSTNPTDGKSHPDFLARGSAWRNTSCGRSTSSSTATSRSTASILFQLHLNDVPSYNQPQLKKTGDRTRL